MQTQQQQEVERRPWRVWWIVGLTVLVVALIGVGIWAIVAANQTEDIDVATDLVDEWLAAWISTDADGVAAVFTEDGVNVDPDGRTFTGRDEIRNNAYAYANLVTAGERTDGLTVTGGGTFTFPVHFDVPRADGNLMRLAGVVEIEVEGDLASRIEWLESSTTAVE